MRKLKNFDKVDVILNNFYYCSNKFIGDAQDNMKVCRHKVNEVLKEYGYKDLMIKREEKFRYRNDLANRIFEIYESL